MLNEAVCRNPSTWGRSRRLDDNKTEAIDGEQAGHPMRCGISRRLHPLACLPGPSPRLVVQNDSLLVRACHISCSSTPAQKRHDLGIVTSQFAFSARLSMVFFNGP